jgi:3-methyladenine DNA glycosylase/8-oxoguanine DNA glycosylase
VVRQRSAKPLFAGSIPAVASKLPLPADFSFPATVESHGWVQLAPFRWDREREVLRRRERLPEGVFDLEMRVRRRTLEVSGAPLSAELAQRLRRMFQLDLSLNDFHRLTRKSEAHQWVAPAKFGRLLCGTTAWEDAVKIIATTNTTWRQTVRMVELLAATCGRDGAFPTPEDVARFSEDELKERCRLGYRAKSVHALARGLATGEIDLQRIADPSQETQSLFRSYLTLPGIGPYGAAHMLAMDGRHDFIAVDTEFRRFVRERYHRGRKVSDGTMLRRYAGWGRWQYLAYWSELVGEGK